MQSLLELPDGACVKRAVNDQKGVEDPMSKPRVLQAPWRSLLRLMGGARRLARRTNPAKLLLVGYSLYALMGWLFLCLPISRTGALTPLDSLFTSVSAVSTTGLVTVDPGTSFTPFGQIIILCLIQAGGVGYMTIGSFIMLARHARLSSMRNRMARIAFSLPNEATPAQFIRTVILFTFACEAVGAIALYPVLARAGIDNPAWSAIFHSVSAFCTAGFSLNSNSFEAFRNDPALNAIISALSLLGALGFLIAWDIWRNFTSRAHHLTYTSKVILRMTALLILAGTAVFFLAEPTITALPQDERLMAAFFQSMTASTTVGFDTHPIGAMGLPSLLFLFLLMAIGASPSGTGGGLKTTTFAAMLGLMRSTLKQRRRVTFYNRPIAPSRLQAAGAAVFYFMVLLTVSVFLLTLTEPGIAFEQLVFEAISALGTVGLSTGITSSLTDLGKIVIIILMMAGRVGILSFGIAVALHEDSEEETADHELVL